MRYATRIFVLTFLVGCLIAPGCGGGGSGEEAPPVGQAQGNWVELDSSRPAGSPARLVIDEAASNDQMTQFELQLAGFYLVEKQGTDGRTYQQVVVPGLQERDEPGAPNLPGLLLHLAIVTDATTASLSMIEPVGVRTFENILVWPRTIPESDHEEGDPEQFIRDDEIYDGSGMYPPQAATSSAPVGMTMRSIRSCTCECNPCQWNPATKQLMVPQSVKYQWSHGGRQLNYEKTPISKERAAVASARFHNWPTVGSILGLQIFKYLADYLVVYPEGYGAALQLLITQKKTRGFRVTEHVLGSPGTCSSVRTIIQNWEDGVPAHHDAYCLLVGDVDWIPLCMQDGSPTDDLYASTNGDDLDEEVYLGRLSVDDTTDCANQVAKILAYEDSPALFCCYDKAALWAHKEDAPGKYEGAHESVRTASYATPPVFTTYYGSQNGVTDAGIAADATSGLGLIAYRGHGSSSATATGWNQTSEYFNSGDVPGVMPSLDRAPPVWSFACTNTKLSTSDCIGELWMTKADGGSVSYYGATIPSYTDQNHELDRRMFKAVYDLGLVTQSHAIEYAEDKMSDIVGSYNAWLYLLLGDPDMQIRRRNPITITFQVPELIEYNPELVPIPVRILVEGVPLEGGLVGMYRTGPTGAPPVPLDQDNGYTDDMGQVILNLVPGELKGSQILLSVEDGQGNSAVGSIPVVPGAPSLER